MHRNQSTKSTPFPVPFVLLLLLSGCGGGDPVPVLGGYKTGCFTASDCIAVAISDVCTACACPDAAINRVDEQRYKSDFAKVRARCDKLPGCIALCVSPQVTCAAGTCALAR